MTILALDLGTKTGWAMRTPEGVIVSGTESFAPGRFEGGGMRYLRFARWLREVTASNTVSAIYFEEVRRHLGVDAAHVYGGLMSHLTAYCELAKIPYQGVPVQTIKKHFTGKGNANKDVMLNEAIQRGYKPADDNEADAIALLDWALKLDGQGVPNVPRETVRTDARKSARTSALPPSHPTPKMEFDDIPFDSVAR